MYEMIVAPTGDSDGNKGGGYGQTGDMGKALAESGNYLLQLDANQWV